MLAKTNFITLANGQRFFPLLNPSNYPRTDLGAVGRFKVERIVQKRSK